MQSICIQKNIAYKILFLHTPKESSDYTVLQTFFKKKINVHLEAEFGWMLEKRLAEVFFQKEM